MQVDVNIPRFNQAVIAAITGVAFLIDRWWLVTVAFVILALSSVGGPSLAPLTRLYVWLIRPWIQAPVVTEPAAPPRFAQMLGALFLGGATTAFLAGESTLGWGLSLVVTTLATLAATTRICLGCILYRKTVAR